MCFRKTIFDVCAKLKKCRNATLYYLYIIKFIFIYNSMQNIFWRMDFFFASSMDLLGSNIKNMFIYPNTVICISHLFWATVKPWYGIHHSHILYPQHAAFKKVPWWKSENAYKYMSDGCVTKYLLAAEILSAKLFVRWTLTFELIFYISPFSNYMS